MKNAKKIIVALMLMAITLVMLSTSAFATENGQAWLDVSASAEGTTVVSIVVDDAVMDGLVELTFDSETLQYVGLETNSDAVAVYSVNAAEAGCVKLAWVAPGAYDAQGGVTLISITFSGTVQQAPVLSGEMNDESGDALQIRSYEAADKTALRKAILVANGLDAANFTEESFIVVEAELEAAEEIMNKEFASQAEVDAAAEALLHAIDMLVLCNTEEGADVVRTELEKAVLIAESLNRYDYTSESFAALEAALATGKSVLENAEATQNQIVNATEELNIAIRALVLNTDVPDTGRNVQTIPVAALIIVSAVSIAAVAALLIFRKGRCVK